MAVDEKKKSWEDRIIEIVQILTFILLLFIYLFAFQKSAYK